MTTADRPVWHFQTGRRPWCHLRIKHTRLIEVAPRGDAVDAAVNEMKRQGLRLCGPCAAAWCQGTGIVTPDGWPAYTRCCCGSGAPLTPDDTLDVAHGICVCGGTPIAVLLSRYESEAAEWQRIKDELIDCGHAPTVYQVTIEQRKRALAEGRRLLSPEQIRTLLDHVP